MREEVCYRGDDLLDGPLLKRVGFPVVPADASPEAKEVAHYITATPGGQGGCRTHLEVPGEVGHHLREDSGHSIALLMVGYNQGR